MGLLSIPATQPPASASWPVVLTKQETTMKKLIGTSALVMALAAPAFAQTATQGDAGMTASPYLEGVERGVRASDFIGKRVYVTETDMASMQVEAMADANTDWDDAGEISDLIISLNGDSEAVLVDFGGFLGLGEKTVAVSMANLVMVPDSDSPDDYFIVFQGSKAALEAAPAFDPEFVFTADESMTTDTTPEATDMTNTGTAATGTMDTGTTEMNTATTGTMNTGDTSVDFATMSDTDLVGKRVVGLNNEDMGEISAVALDGEGKISGAVVDVGGFLGMGEKPVALGAETLTMVRSADGTADHFTVTMTQEQLETLPIYAN
jgi:hypothetical protein